MSFSTSPFTTWDQLSKQARALIEGEPDLIANLANLSALFKDSLRDLNWAGFYLWNAQDQELVLGPFQGKPACIRIKPPRGVCGKAWTSQETQTVADVNAFPGHIACDSATESELVVPLIWNQACVGVLDLDSPLKDRFTQTDARELTALMQKLVPQLWSTKDRP